MKNIRTTKCFTFVFFAYFVFVNFAAQAQIITTLAGNGSYSYSGDGGLATAASMSQPWGLIVDVNGNVYIGDAFNNVVRKVTPSGIITTIAGTGTAGYTGDGGQATACQLRVPFGVGVDGAGNIYISDNNNNKIRKINTSGIITTIAGAGYAGYGGDGGPATAAQISQPDGLAVDNAGNVYLPDGSNHRVRKIDTAGIISTIAGIGTDGYSGDGGAATAAQLGYATDIALDDFGNVYFADYRKHCVRKISSAGIITTVAGTGIPGYSGDGGPATAANLNQPIGLDVDLCGNIFISDGANNRIRFVSAVTGIITTIAGNGTAGASGDGGPATAATMNVPHAIHHDTLGNIYFVDRVSNKVRKITNTNYPVSFVGGSSRSINICQDSTATALNSLLAISDTDAGQTEVWSIYTLPSHGTLSGFSFTATSSGGSVTPSGLSYTPAIGYSGMDSFKISVSDCRTSDIITIYVTIAPLPVVGAIAGPTAVCLGSASIILTDTALGGTWTSSSSSIATISSSGVVSAISAGVILFTYSVSNSCGTAFDTLVFAVDTNPHAGVIAGPRTVCTGTSAALSVTGSSGAGIWSSSSSSIATVSASGIVSALTAGNVVISYSVTNSCGASVDTLLINASVMPSAGTVSGALTICTGTTIALSVTGASAGGTWSCSSSTAASVDTLGIVTGLAVGSVIITYTVTNSCGTSSDTMAVTINLTPRAGTISGISTICTGSSTALSVAGSSGAGAWSSSASSIASVNSSGGVAGIAVGSATITYTVANSCGSSFTTLGITVVGLPTGGTISGPTVVCTGSSISLSASSSGGAWGSSSTHGTVNSVGVVLGLSAGIMVVSYTFTNICGSVSDTMAITVVAPPHAGPITGLDTICQGATSAFAAASGSGVWSSSDPSIASISATGVVTALLSGSVVINYSVGNTCGSDSAVKNIFISAMPDAGIIISNSGEHTLCVGYRTNFTETVSGGIWYSSNTAIATVDVAGTVSGLSPGVVDIRYIVSNTCGSDTSFFSLTIISGGACQNGVQIQYATERILQIIPNPNAGVFTINIASDLTEEANIFITSMLGIRVKQFNLKTNKKFDVELAVVPGVYFIFAYVKAGMLVEKIEIK